MFGLHCRGSPSVPTATDTIDYCEESIEATINNMLGANSMELLPSSTNQKNREVLVRCERQGDNECDPGERGWIRDSLVVSWLPRPPFMVITSERREEEADDKQNNADNVAENAKTGVISSNTEKG